VYRGHIKAFTETYEGMKETALAVIHKKVLKLREDEELLSPAKVPVPSAPKFPDEDASTIQARLESMLNEDDSLDEEDEEGKEDEEEEEDDDGGKEVEEDEDNDGGKEVDEDEDDDGGKEVDEDEEAED
jgi:hypothetical protein